MLKLLDQVNRHLHPLGKGLVHCVVDPLEVTSLERHPQHGQLPLGTGSHHLPFVDHVHDLDLLGLEAPVLHFDSQNFFLKHQLCFFLTICEPLNEFLLSFLLEVGVPHFLLGQVIFHIILERLSFVLKFLQLVFHGSTKRCAFNLLVRKVLNIKNTPIDPKLITCMLLIIHELFLRT